MKKLITTLLIIIQNFSLFITAILSIIFYNSFNINFYEKFYKKEHLASQIGTTDNSLLNNTKNLLNYLNGKGELNKDWFSQKDILHMVDVKYLYNVSYNIMITCFCIFIIISLALFFIYKKEALLLITKLFNKILFLFIAIVGIIAIFVSQNFTEFWIKFHMTIFTNDLWLLSPSESNLIKMVPEEFFISLVTTIISHVLILFILLFIINILIRKKLKQK